MSHAPKHRLRTGTIVVFAGLAVIAYWGKTIWSPTNTPNISQLRTLPLSMITMAKLAPPDEAFYSEAAQAAYHQAVAKFRATANHENGLQQIDQSMLDIAQRWPNTAAAISAQLFRINTLKPDLANPSNPSYEATYLDQAIAYPNQYFSDQYQANTQHIAKQVIDALIDKRDHRAASQYCWQLRWLAQQISAFAGPCATVLDTAPDAASNAQSTPAFALAWKHPIDIDTLTDTQLERAHIYLQNPYRADNMAQAAMALSHAGRPKLAKLMLNEMLLLDPVAVPTFEMQLYREHLAKKRAQKAERPKH